MGTRSVIGMCVAVGSILGGYVPTLWGAGDFSMSSLLFSAVGGLAGIWLGRRLSEDL